MTCARRAGGELGHQRRGVLALPQHFRPQHLLGDFGMRAQQLIGEGAPVEEQRQHAEELRIGGAAVEELLARSITLGEVGDPAQRRHRLGELRHDFVKGVDEVLEAHDEFAIHLLPAVAAHKETQFVRGPVRRAQPAAQPPGEHRGRAWGGEEFPPVLKFAVARLAAKEPFVDVPHPGAYGVELMLEFPGRCKPQRARNGGHLGGIGRERVRLVLLAHLDRVLDAAQEPVCLLQEPRLPRLHQSVAHQLVQRRGGRMRLQKGIAAGMQQLERLGDELDFTNAAMTRFHVARQGLGADHLLLGAGLHGRDLGQQRRRRMARITERMQALEQLRAQREVAGDRPRLDERHALPGLSGGGVIMFESRERAHQRAVGAFRPQTYVNAEQKAVGGLGLQQAGDGLGHLGEEFDV